MNSTQLEHAAVLPGRSHALATMRVWLMKAMSGWCELRPLRLGLSPLAEPSWLPSHVMTVLSKSTVTAPTLICEKNHLCKGGNTAVLRACENLPKNRL